MKFVKKVISIILVCTIIASMSVLNSFAFGGYAHWWMGNYIASSSGKNSTAKLAYKSGCLLADIGKTLWDNQYGYDSDQYNMALSMYLNVSMNPNNYDNYAAYMYYGWRDHYHQDLYGRVSNTNPPHTNYKYNCGWIDEYLRDELADISYPIRNNELSELYIDYQLIRDSYNALCGYSPTNFAIKTEIIAMFAAYDLQITLNIKGWSQTDRTNIMNELRRSRNYCDGLTMTAPDYQSTSTYSVSADLNKEEELYSLSSSQLALLTNYISIQETPISNSASILKMVVSDETAYNQCLNDIAAQKLESI